MEIAQTNDFTLQFRLDTCDGMHYMTIFAGVFISVPGTGNRFAAGIARMIVRASTLLHKFSTYGVIFTGWILSLSAMTQHRTVNRQRTDYLIMRTFLIALILLTGIFAGRTVLAEETESVSSIDSPWRFGVGLGYGKRSNPLALSDDITILVDLDIAWFGERWFFDNGDLGFTVLDDDRYTVNLVGQFNSDRVFFSKTNSKFISTSDGVSPPVIEQIEVPDRDYAVEVGVEFLTDGVWGDLQLAAFRDISNTHGGYELSADYSYSVRRQRWLYRPSIGASWKSNKLNDYYWGVQESEANSEFPAYRASSGLNTHARFLTSFQINPHWAFIAVAEYERLNSEASASPIVKERGVFGMFAGFKYEY
jgi:outer membrane protein